MKKKIIKPKEKITVTDKKVVCNERGCEDPYGQGYDCHVCLKR